MKVTFLLTALECSQSGRRGIVRITYSITYVFRAVPRAQSVSYFTVHRHVGMMYLSMKCEVLLVTFLEDDL